MADTPGDVSGTLSICNVSPSDQAGQINNLMDRVLNLEIAVAKLAGLDVTATNASDLVESLGTITNGVIIMPDNSVTGWTNSIPPGDFTGTIISNGVITTWNNGVVSFQVDSTGISTGGGSPKRIVRTEMDTTSISNGGRNDLSFANPTITDDTIGASWGATSFTVPTSGQYFVSDSVWFLGVSSIQSGSLDSSFYTDSGNGYLTWAHAWALGAGSSETHVYDCFYSGIVDLVAGDNCYVDAYQQTGAARDVGISNLSIIKL